MGSRVLEVFKDHVGAYSSKRVLAFISFAVAAVAGLGGLPTAGASEGIVWAFLIFAGACLGITSVDRLKGSRGAVEYPVGGSTTTEAQA